MTATSRFGGETTLTVGGAITSFLAANGNFLISRHMGIDVSSVMFWVDSGDRVAVHDSRRSLLTAALWFAVPPPRHDQPEVAMLRRWLDTWTGLGLVTVGMARQGFGFT